jgi:nicotinate dehydrogenase subunit B
MAIASGSITRRQALAGVIKGTGALIVGFSFAPALAQSQRPAGSRPAGAPGVPPAGASELDSWLKIAPDGEVTVFTSKVELGTGVETALAQIVAEELDVPVARIHMITGDTARSVDQAVTSASRTVMRAGPQLRQAAAVAHQHLLKLAAARLKAPVSQLRVEDGVVTVADNPRRRVSYGKLIGDRRFDLRMPVSGSGWEMQVAPGVRAKDPKDYKIVGTSVPRFDLPPKFTGEFVYVHDVRVDGMLHGRVVRPPVVNSAPLEIDESSLRSIPDLVQVVHQGNFVGVVTRSEWSAIQAAAALKVRWATPAIKLPADDEALYAYLRDTAAVERRKVAHRGDADAALRGARRPLQATYRWPFQLHAMIGPSCAVADVRSDGVTIWSGTQGPFNTRHRVAQLLGVPETQVRVIYREGAGCYGRLSSDDVSEDAALMSRAVGKPVRVLWTRHDEHGWEPKGPAQLMFARAGLDSGGQLQAWDFLDRGFPWTTNTNPLLASQQVGHKPTQQGMINGFSGGGEIYSIANQRVLLEAIPWLQYDLTPLRTSNLRAPGAVARCFASESFMDEVAAAAGIDPVRLRLQYLKDRRLHDVLVAALERASSSRKRAANGDSLKTGRGVALANQDDTAVAAVAEVEVDTASGQIRVTRVVEAHDCGRIVNPNGLRNQIEGNVVQSVGRALLEQVQFDASGVRSLDWLSYPIIKFEAVPEVDVVLINRIEMEPLGAGEPSSVPVVGAIANAVFDATGARLRAVPFTPARVLAALKEASPHAA